MQEFKLKPSIFEYDTVKEFVNEFSIGLGDLIITNQYIYDPYFTNLELECDVLYQEKYGMGEPSDSMVTAMYADIKKSYKRIIAIGGGTVIDIAKIFALKCFIPIVDLYDGKIELEKNKELVLVPTTCGTGSEVTNISILALESRNTKKGIAAEELYCDAAVLIPELLKGLPFKFFATSSIDALIHAIESYLSPKANVYTRMFSCEAIKMILQGYMEIRDNGKERRISLLKDFLIASNYAGIAFGNAGCGAVHALSYPFGATYHVPHGESNYVVFTSVMKNYMEIQNNGEIEKLNIHISNILDCDKNKVYQELENLLDEILPKKTLKEYGVGREELMCYTDSVLKNQQRLLQNAFIPLDKEKILKIYIDAYDSNNL